ncbi:MAG: twin-arginine translocase TatA/TatE family subunit [Planctomycetota bacterium]
MPEPTPLLIAFLGPIGWPEMVILAILGVLIFGKRLPEVGKSVGKGIVEFKKGLSGVEDDLDDAVKATKQLDDPKAKADPGVTVTQNEPANAENTSA